MSKLLDDFFKSINFDYHILDKYEIIYCLVSGGYDSTLLSDWLESKFPDRIQFVNCFNPLEANATLKYFEKKKNFISVKKEKDINFLKIIKESFKKIPEAIQLKKQGKYHKKIFPCCRKIKHDAFKKNKLFINPKSCVISGIKAGDGQQRGFWLNDLRKGKYSMKKATFEHKHKWGANYVYPFRDYRKRDFPKKINSYLEEKFPKISHSGCYICPVLIVFNLKKASNYNSSLKYHNSLFYQKLKN